MSCKASRSSRRPTCLRLLGTGRIGRVGFVSDGQPHVLPVNYVASDAGEVVFRTTDGSVLTAVAGGPAVFEIDGYDEQSRDRMERLRPRSRAGDH